MDPEVVEGKNKRKKGLAVAEGKRVREALKWLEETSLEETGKGLAVAQKKNKKRVEDGRL